MNIVDLSHTIKPGIPVFPGTDPPRFDRDVTIEADGFLETRMTLYSHTGTHIDVPAHMLPEGRALSDYRIDRFIGKAVCVGCPNLPGTDIGVAQLAPYQRHLEGADFVLLKTGWSEKWGTGRYFKGFPVLSPEAAEWLVRFGFKGIGIDALSVDSTESQNFRNHHILFENDTLIIENLTHLHSLPPHPFLFSCLPLKLQDGDGSPVRAVAITDYYTR